MQVRCCILPCIQPAGQLPRRADRGFLVGGCQCAASDVGEKCGYAFNCNQAAMPLSAQLCNSPPANTSPPGLVASKLCTHEMTQ
eukprot:scaffold148296_cov14-Tisochrysis_lutea.AAC.1